MSPSSPVPSGESSGDVTETLESLCADPSCRSPYQKVIGRGRPQRFCSETCRRRAEKSLRKVRSRLRHYDEMATISRIDIAAHGREDGEGDTELDLRQSASNAIGRAEAALRFLTDRDDPAVNEFRRLYEAVAPLLANR